MIIFLILCILISYIFIKITLNKLLTTLTKFNSKLIVLKCIFEITKKLNQNLYKDLWAKI